MASRPPASRQTAQRAAPLPRIPVRQEDQGRVRQGLVDSTHVYFKQGQDPSMVAYREPRPRPCTSGVLYSSRRSGGGQHTLVPLTARNATEKAAMENQLTENSLIPITARAATERSALEAALAGDSGACLNHIRLDLPSMGGAPGSAHGAAIKRLNWNEADSLLQVADELWRLGLEHKHAWDQEPGSPDPRLRQLHDQLVHLAELLLRKIGNANRRLFENGLGKPDEQLFEFGLHEKQSFAAARPTTVSGERLSRNVHRSSLLIHSVITETGGGDPVDDNPQHADSAALAGGARELPPPGLDEGSCGKLMEENSWLKRELADIAARVAKSAAPTAERGVNTGESGEGSDIEEILRLKRELAESERRSFNLRAHVAATTEMKHQLSELSDENLRLKREMEGAGAAPAHSGALVAGPPGSAVAMDTTIKLSELADENSRLKQALAESEAELAHVRPAREARGQLTELAEENSRLKQALAESEAELAHVRPPTEDQNCQLTELMDENARLKQALAESEATLAHVRPPTEDQNCQLTELAEENARLRRDLADRDSQLADRVLPTTAENTQLADVMDENTRLRRDLADRDAQLASMRLPMDAKMSEPLEENSRLTRDLALPEVVEESACQRATLAELAAPVATASSDSADDAEACRKVAELVGEVARSKREWAASERRCAALQVEVSGLAEENSRLKLRASQREAVVAVVGAPAAATPPESGTPGSSDGAAKLTEGMPRAEHELAAREGTPTRHPQVLVAGPECQPAAGLLERFSRIATAQMRRRITSDSAIVLYCAWSLWCRWHGGSVARRQLAAASEDRQGVARALEDVERELGEVQARADQGAREAGGALRESLREAGARARGRSVAAAEFALAGADGRLVKVCLTAWARSAQSVLRRRRYQGTCMLHMARYISDLDGALLSYCLLAWSCRVAEGRQDHSSQQAAASARLARRKRLEPLRRHFAMLDRLLVWICLVTWHALRLLKGRKKAIALGGIVASEGVLQARCLAAWSASCQQGRLVGQLVSSQGSREHIAGAHRHAVAVLGKVLGRSSHYLLLLCFFSIRGEVVAAQLEHLYSWKRENMRSHIQKDIAAKDFLVRSVSFYAWAKIAQETLKVDRRQRYLERCRAVIVRLRDRLIMKNAWDAWFIRALM